MTADWLHDRVFGFYGLTGSPAVSFGPTASGGTASSPKRLMMMAHAVVCADGEHFRVPGQREYVELMLLPKVPTT